MNQFSSAILAKTNNCFYALLDSDLKFEIVNNKFKDLFDLSQTQPSYNFLSLFSKSDKEKWERIFQHAETLAEYVQTATIPLKNEKAEISIEWNICASRLKEGLVNYEILGVPAAQLCKESLPAAANTNAELAAAAKKNLQNTMALTALSRQETRFRSVLDKLKKVLNSSLDIICVISADGKFTRVSRACKNILGYEPRELVGKSFIEFVFEDDLERTIEENSSIKKGLSTTNFENRYYRKDGSLAWLMWSSKWEEEDQKFYSIGRDATEKKMAEAALKATQEKYRVIFNDHPFPMFIYDITTYMVLEVNEAAVIQYGFSANEFLKMKITDFLQNDEINKFYTYYSKKENHYVPQKGLWLHKRKNGEIFYAEVTARFLNYEGAEAKLVLAIDRTEQLNAEKELIKSNERYKFLSLATFDAIWDVDLKTNEVTWGEGVKKVFQTEDLSVMKKMDGWLNNLHHEDRERVETKLNNHLQQRKSHWEDEFRFKISDTAYKYISARGYALYNENGEPSRMIGAMQDNTENKAHQNMLQQLNSNLEKRAKELLESNAELERFAYVASHDLQEPLRMVTSFLQLLERRYKDKLDQKAHEYIAYAVDGAERMKRLILDLLEYSRVNSSVIQKEDVDINEVINDLRLTYKNLLQETDGAINSGKLPLVKGNKTQILQLFQNLIGNAFKYRSEKPPVVDISCKEDNNSYKFAITDNGIGIDPKFFQKIFIIFQRLHQREQYSGTGIGLAICKKIIDKHGGRIWVNSTPGHGSTFYFTLPRSK